MIERLEQIKNRYNEIKENLSKSEVLEDIKKTTELSKEMSSLEEIVNTYKEYENILQGIKDAKEMINDKDLGEFAKEELSNLFYTLMENNHFIDGMLVEFKKLVEKANQNLDLKSVIKFILDKLHKELNEFKNIENQIEINVCGLEESKIYTVFTNLYNKNNKSIVQQLFFGEKELITKCSSCNNTQYSFEVIQMFYYDLEKYKENIKLKKLFEDFEQNYEKVWSCNKCNNNQNAIFRPIIKKLPQIMIVCLDKYVNNRRIEYYLNTKIHDEEYTLICFITNSDEKDNKVGKYNVFYKENENWYIYNITERNKAN